MNKKFILIFCHLFILLAVTGHSSDTNTYMCQRRDGELRLDGMLDEKTWDGKEVAVQFWKSKDTGLAHYQAKAYAMWDDNTLYIAAKMDDEDVVGHLNNRDDPIYNEDAFEIFILPDPQSRFVFEFEFSPQGVIFDALSRRLPNNKSGYRGETARGWNAGGLICKAAVDGTLNDFRDKDRGWSVEVKIPFSAFKRVVPKPKVGDKWKITFARCESSVYLDDVEWSSSVPLMKYGCWENYDEWKWLEFR